MHHALYTMAGSTSTASYAELFSGNERGPSGARYYEHLLAALYAAAGNPAAMHAFQQGLTPAEWNDLEWWLDEVFARYAQYQRIAAEAMAQRQAPPPAEGSAARTTPIERMKRAWAMTQGDLMVAYLFHDIPYGSGVAALKRWAEETAPIRQARQDRTWVNFLHSLGVVWPPKKEAKPADEGEEGNA